MNLQKIAILVDSCMDVPSEVRAQYNMYMVPVKIVYHDKTYLDDGVDITASYVYDNLVNEIPTTSLPDGQTVLDTLNQIVADGYEKLLVLSISGHLSGTCNMLRLLCADFDALESVVIDTKNIAVASGLIAIRAAQLIEEGLDFASLVSAVQNGLSKTKVFICLSTLKYLQKGGRIGRVASFFGNALDIKPIITCDDEGIYYSVAKVRGRNCSIARAIDLAVEFVKNNANTVKYNLAVYQGAAQGEIAAVKEKLLQLLPEPLNLYEGQITPSLGVHTGPGLIGIAVQVI